MSVRHLPGVRGILASSTSPNVPKVCTRSVSEHCNTKHFVNTILVTVPAKEADFTSKLRFLMISLAFRIFFLRVFLTFCSVALGGGGPAGAPASNSITAKYKNNRKMYH